MSNEKPVRITVGDVNEVAEATTVQKVTPISSVAPRSTPTTDKSGNGLVYLGGLAGCVFFLAAGYLGLVHGVKPVDVPESAITKTKSTKPATTPADGANKPAVDSATANNAATPSAPATSSNNAPAATNNAPETNAPSN